MTCAPVFSTPAAELAELAVECLAIARHDGGMFSATTPGIPAAEIEAAVDAALATAGATP
jgi:hypothetical protein